MKSYMYEVLENLKIFHQLISCVWRLRLSHYCIQALNFREECEFDLCALVSFTSGVYYKTGFLVGYLFRSVVLLNHPNQAFNRPCCFRVRKVETVWNCPDYIGDDLVWWNFKSFVYCESSMSSDVTSIDFTR